MEHFFSSNSSGHLRSDAHQSQIIGWDADSSVARGGAGGAIAPPIGLPTKMQNKENTTFLALLRLSFALDQTKNDLKHSLKRLFGGGANRLPTKMLNRENTTFLAF